VLIPLPDASRIWLHKITKKNEKCKEKIHFFSAEENIMNYNKKASIPRCITPLGVEDNGEKWKMQRKNEAFSVSGARVPGRGARKGKSLELRM